jgi:hypothetical protein
MSIARAVMDANFDDMLALMSRPASDSDGVIGHGSGDGREAQEIARTHEEAAAVCACTRRRRRRLLWET